MTTPPLEEEQAEALLAEVVGDSTTGDDLPMFFLHSLKIEGFRTLEKAVFTFQPGLNVIIGANNAAKTAIIDALRIVFNLGTFENKEDPIRLRPRDIFMDGSEPAATRSIALTATFYGKTGSDLPAQFYELLCPEESVKLGKGDEEYAVFRLRYRVEFSYSNIKKRYEYARNDVRGGVDLRNPVAYEVLDSIRSIYLAPLRDLVNDRTRVGAEIERLILSHTPQGKEEERRSIPEELRERAAELIKKLTENKHQDAAGENLASYASPYGIQKDSLSFLPAGITESLFGTMWPVFAHGLHGAEGLPLSSNGLGINQLIYASIVLSRRGDAEVDGHIRKFFLIEEPEAHLHPQLQDSFFHALNQIRDHQLFVTSHSPTITAKTDLDKIIVMRRDTADRTAVPLHLAEVFKGREHDKEYLHKFLDVTRSQLLFAKGAVFVEGITEAMLMQLFSELIGLSLRSAGVEIVVINSSEGYGHFRPLFDKGDGAFCRAVFVTDNDESPRAVKTDDDFRADADGLLDERLRVEENTAIAAGYGTFEFGLLRTSIAGGGNEAMQQLLTAAMQKAAPPSVKNQNAEAAFAKDFFDFDHPSRAYQKMKERTKYTCLTDDDWYGTWITNGYFKDAKSDFAFYLHQALTDLPVAEARQKFVVPKYIERAIRFVVSGEGAEELGSGSDA